MTKKTKTPIVYNINTKYVGVNPLADKDTIYPPKLQRKLDEANAILAKFPPPKR